MQNKIINFLIRFFLGWVVSYIFTICFQAFGWIKITGSLGYGNDKFVVPIFISLIVWTVCFFLVEVTAFIFLIILSTDIGLIGLVILVMELMFVGYLASKLILYLFPEGVIQFSFNETDRDVYYLGFGAPYMIAAVVINFQKFLGIADYKPDSKKKKSKKKIVIEDSASSNEQSS